jgi:hypothetical protein
MTTMVFRLRLLRVPMYATIKGIHVGE